ncbi:uncharacterized protein LOC118508451 [Anopheles stephensi]|uniref:uncharacterized protein LOC118508451 n=1 Tax=Anopheles stephensi TaxID=30069 RepID=UPI001658AC95|nr:uncharacterized protein LOC118508451 [Anopheles stephensi]
MEKEETISPIQQLPYEVLCKIFDFLDINSVKQCSRTCRRWQETIFSDYYIKRFKMSISLPLCRNEEMQTLKQSNRLYCNVNLRLCSSTAPCVNGAIFNGIYTIFCYPKLEQLVTLKVAIPTVQHNAKRMLTDAIKHMKHLRELHIDSSTGSLIESNQMDRIQILSQSIQSLVAQAILPTIVKAPKLTSLRVVIYTHQTVPVHNEKMFYSCRLPNLQDLELEKKSNGSFASRLNVNHVLTFFSNLKSLQTLRLKNERTCGYLFKAICEHCINLKELFVASLHIVETSTLRNLSNLANLRHLTFEHIECLEPVPFRAVQLPNLESLAIGSFPILPETLSAFRCATKITMLGKNMTPDLITAIATNMPNLKHIGLKHFSAATLQLLHLFVVAEVLTVEFSISLLVYSRGTVANIKEIHSLITETPKASDIEHLRSQFPKLKLLKVGTMFEKSFQN